MSLLLLIPVASFGAVPLARWISNNRHDVLLAPALLLTIWVIVIGALVRTGWTLAPIWLPFWFATFVAVGIGLSNGLKRGVAVLLPVAVACAVMAPYLMHGIADYPGSWFWDGFAYLALGESLWINPRGQPVPHAELFYEFGAAMANGRFSSGALISLFKGVFPIGGDAQQAVGYFLFLCIFTFACSSAYLAQVALPTHRLAQAAFVALATVSGPIINLLWANNFDNLLAMAIAPAVIGLALDLRWGDVRGAIALGIVVAAEIYIYPEMAALLVLPSFLIFALRLFDRGEWRAKGIAVGFGLVALLVLLVPAADILTFFMMQFGAALQTAAGDRPGNGYFPTLFTLICGPGAVIGLYPPFGACRMDGHHFVRIGAGLGATAIGAYALLRWRRAPGLAVNTVLLCLAFGYFVLAQRYDYGAFKILASGWTPTLLLMVLAVADSPRYVKAASLGVACLCFGAAVGQVRAFDQAFQHNSIRPFSELAGAIPGRAVVDLRIDNHYAFEWAAYYLRDRYVAVSRGRLAYYASPNPDQEPTVSRLTNTQFIVTDSALASRTSTWSNSVYRVYAVDAKEAARD